MARVMMTFSKLVLSLYSGGFQSVVCGPPKARAGDLQNYMFQLEVKGTAVNVVNVLYLQQWCDTHTHTPGVFPSSDGA
jgi:hypothetical protein